MELYSIKAEEPIGTIGIPVRDHINAATATSIFTSALAPGGWFAGRSIDINIVQGSILTQQRNELVRRMRGDWLMMIDDDMVWQPEQIRQLVEARAEHDLDVLGGLCFRRAAPYQPTLFMREQPTSGSYNYLETWDEDSIVEVDATGMAFVVIHRRVFEGVADGRDLFRWDGQYGEDLQFCQDVKNIGGRVFVHTGIEVGHISEVTITSRHFLIELAQRDEASLSMRRQLNGDMGLPTVEPAEAKRRLGW